MFGSLGLPTLSKFPFLVVSSQNLTIIKIVILLLVLVPIGVHVHKLLLSSLPSLQYYAQQDGAGLCFGCISLYRWLCNHKSWLEFCVQLLLEHFLCSLTCAVQMQEAFVRHMMCIRWFLLTKMCNWLKKNCTMVHNAHDIQCRVTVLLWSSIMCYVKL